MWVWRRNVFLAFCIGLLVIVFGRCMGKKLLTSRIPEKVVDGQNISDDPRSYTKEYAARAGRKVTVRGN
jgi:hypothetical protein